MKGRAARARDLEDYTAVSVCCSENTAVWEVESGWGASRGTLGLVRS